MLNKVSISYLIICILVAAIEYAHLPPPRTVLFGYVWAILSLSFPFFYKPTRSGMGFLRSILILLLILTISHVVELIVILLQEGGVQEILHPDSMTVVLYGFHCIEPAAAAIIWFPIGFLGYWYLSRQRPS